MARPGFKNHPKFRRLVHILGEPIPHCLGYLECIWAVGYECGNPLIGDAKDLELAAEYPGKPGTLAKALVDCRFVDLDGDGRYLIHDLFDHAPDYVLTRREREQERHKDKTCHFCERVYRSTERHSKFCSPNCRVAAHRGQKRPVTECNGQLRNIVTHVTECNEPPAPAPAPAPAPLFCGKKKDRDELWFAVAEVMHADPESSAREIGRVVAALRKADPPYTASEVLDLPSILEQQGFAPPPLRPGAITGYIGWVRNRPKAKAKSKASAEEMQAAFERRKAGKT